MFDEFAVGHFKDQMVVVLNRPELEGAEIAGYAYGDQVIGDNITDFLFFYDKPIESFIITPLPDFNLYMLTMQYTQDDTVKVQQFTLTYDYDKKYGLFTPFGEEIVPPFQSVKNSADTTPDLIAAGCVDCNRGYGEIYLVDT